MTPLAAIHPHHPAGLPHTKPFESAEQAWFWTSAALAARRDGTGSSGGAISRPCDPDDVVKCLDLLYRRRRIDLVHARILRIWGARQTAPNPAATAERCDWRIWTEALERLDWPLRAKGIIGKAGISSRKPVVGINTLTQTQPAR